MSWNIIIHVYYLCYFPTIINNVQSWCFKVVAKVNDELEKQLVSQDVMDVGKLVYPKY
jgi:hypothetical protein